MKDIQPYLLTAELEKWFKKQNIHMKNGTAQIKERNEKREVEIRTFLVMQEKRTMEIGITIKSNAPLEGEFYFYVLKKDAEQKGSSKKYDFKDKEEMYKKILNMIKEIEMKQIFEKSGLYFWEMLMENAKECADKMNVTPCPQKIMEVIKKKWHCKNMAEIEICASNLVIVESSKEYEIFQSRGIKLINFEKDQEILLKYEEWTKTN